jgi:phosphatidylglycerophosphate synthase
MLPAPIAPFIMPHLEKLAHWVAARGISANTLTLISFLAAIGVMAAIGLHIYWLGIVMLMINRVCDGIDGIVARIHAAKHGGRLSPFGTFADTLTDIFLYGGIVFAFVLGNLGFAVAATFLLFSWLLSAFASLAFDIEAESKGLEEEIRTRKALLFFDGVSSQLEMTTVLALMCVFPAYFPAIATIYGIICLLTVGSRVLLAYKYLR